MEFKTIKTAVAEQFGRMQEYPLFQADVSGDEVWEAYLAAFPPGTNPLYRERTEHDCSCCRQFVRAVGNVVAVVDGSLVSLWDVGVPDDTAYGVVATTLSRLVLSRPILGPFLHPEPVAGVDRTFEQLLAPSPESVRTWSHFFVNIDRRFVRPSADIPALFAEQAVKQATLLRGLREITDEAVDTVLDLVAQNSLYRGEEHRALVLQFQALRRAFSRLPDERAQDIFAWIADASGAIARIRNTAIGTLLVDLSDGRDLEGSVRSFEAKVAPTNYQRPNALVTKAMVEAARTALGAMGLVSALDRRFARIGDVTINNLLFADRTARRALTGDVFDELAVRPTTGNLDRVEEVPIGRFLDEIVPRAESLEVLFENHHSGNLVSLIAPSDPTARHLFKWPNNFSWSYVGEVADAIRERVKKAGGNVTGDLCCRLAWSNFDDLDLHMAEPGGYHLYFGNRYTTSPSGGRLDVDMNVSPTTREPVENIFYANRRDMREGTYRLYVHQYNARETADCGFECEIAYLGTVYRFAHPAPVRLGETVDVATFRYTHAGGVEIVESLPTTSAQRTTWGLRTQDFHRVRALMLSPNHWDDRGVGNKHYLFMLEGCRNDGTARGFFNEFLAGEFAPHRRVFEAVAAKMKPADSDEQLSGLGFSSTQRNAVVCRVRGSFTRVVKVIF